MITVETKIVESPRKATQHYVLLVEDGKQLASVLSTPYEALALMTIAAFKALLGTPKGELLVRQQLAELP